MLNNRDLKCPNENPRQNYGMVNHLPLGCMVYTPGATKISKLQLSTPRSWAWAETYLECQICIYKEAIPGREIGLETGSECAPRGIQCGY